MNFREADRRVIGLWQYHLILWPHTQHSSTYFMNSFNAALSTVFGSMLTNLCVTSRCRVSCRCEGKTTDHRRPWSEAACRPPSLLHGWTGQIQKKTMKSTKKWLQKMTVCLIVLTSDLLCGAARPCPMYAARWGTVCRALHHFNGEGLLIHAGTGAACHSTSTE